MILCTTQALEKYSYDHEYGVRVGIGKLYEQKPTLFSMISLMSPIFYQWEAGSPVPLGDRAASFDVDLTRLYESSLGFSIGGLSLSQWLTSLDSPTALYLTLGQFALTGFPLLQFYDRDQLNLVMRARCYSWLQAWRLETNLDSLFYKDEETIVKENAYGKYSLS